MSDEYNNKDNNFSFIQEQITSKKKSRWKRMLLSLVWTIVLGCIFGVIAGVAFCISVPKLNGFLNVNKDKKTVEFPTMSPDDEHKNNTNPDSGGLTEENKENTEGNNGQDPGNENSTEGENTNEGTAGEQAHNPETVVIEKFIPATIEDYSNIYAELRSIANHANRSMVTVTSVSKGLDWFKNEYEAIKVTSGVIVADNGAELLILVSLDKIKEANSIKVTFFNSIEAEGALKSYDTDLNIAAIGVKLKDIPEQNRKDIKPAKLGESFALVVGTPIIALGNPNGYVGSMELGAITSKGNSAYITDNKIELFNTDINDNKNGEGVIINLKGEVIGIITQVLKDEVNENVNTAIGISRMKKIIESLVNNQNRVYFGIKGIDMTADALEKAGIVSGISVTEVEPESPALEAGLKSGDIILTVNETPISSMNSFYNIISLYEPKAPIHITVKRGTKNEAKDLTLDVVLEKKNN
ncbi:S1C family serine protease [Anaerocolumna aminovalerica]|uniref:S1C family serine protease n=1 Tax=Anaerocolumna aminovalerica TaxID=1527 RepID=UPI00248B2159|nr:PDZ domain-containing protein [Anaerocolumna aminovalerica]